jgi:hypothetical protein
MSETTQSKLKVIEVYNKISMVHTQIVIDLFQDDLTDLLDKEDITPEDIGAFGYHVGCLIEVFNPIYDKDIQLLKEVDDALGEWEDDQSFVNKSLGLDPNQ